MFAPTHLASSNRGCRRFFPLCKTKKSLLFTRDALPLSPENQFSKLGRLFLYKISFGFGPLPIYLRCTVILPRKKSQYPKVKFNLSSFLIVLIPINPLSMVSNLYFPTFQALLDSQQHQVGRNLFFEFYFLFLWSAVDFKKAPPESH